MKIPRHEPEVIAAGARHYCDGDEKVPTTSLNPIFVGGVKIESRYGKADELELMRRFILDLPAPMRRKVAWTWCDSKATYCFTVLLRDWRAAEAIGRAIEASAMEHCRGHNGISVAMEDKSDPSNMFGDSHRGEFYLDPNWVGDFNPPEAA